MFRKYPFYIVTYYIKFLVHTVKDPQIVSLIVNEPFESVFRGRAGWGIGPLSIFFGQMPPNKRRGKGGGEEGKSG